VAEEFNEIFSGGQQRQDVKILRRLRDWFVPTSRALLVAW